MTALVVIGVIILALVTALNVPVTAHIKFYGGKLDVRVKYFGIGVFPKKTRKKRSKKRKGFKPPPSETEGEEEIFEDIAQIGFADKGGEASESAAEEDEIFDKNSDLSENEEGAFEDVFESRGADTKEKSESRTENSDGLRPKKSKKKSPQKRFGKKKSKAIPEGKDGGKPKKSLGERVSAIAENIENKKNAALLLWELCGGHLKKLLGKISVTGLVIDFAAADEDAAKAALKYGELSAGFYNFLGVLMSITRLGIKSVNVDCLYNTPAEKSRYDGEFKVKLRPASVSNALAAVLFGYVRGGKKYKSALNEFLGGDK